MYMKYNKIVLAGGSGYIGEILIVHFKDVSNEIVVLNRSRDVAEGNVRYVRWDGKTKGAWMNELEGADMLVNLCGKSVNCRYNEQNKREILNSRVMPTALLGEVIERLKVPPKLWINVTTATIYRHAEDRPQDEITGEIGQGFSVDVAKQWEAAFMRPTKAATRKIALRMAMVMGKGDSVLKRLVNLAKCGLGGKQGDGKQYVTWIHEEDVANIIEWLLAHEDVSGVINCTAPGPLPNAEMMRLIRKACGVKIGLPAPKWLLELGAFIIGTETELLLKSRWVMPKILLDSGYVFKYPTFEKAVGNLMEKAN
jgi:hypothetical protein